MPLGHETRAKVIVGKNTTLTLRVSSRKSMTLVTDGVLTVRERQKPRT